MIWLTKLSLVIHSQQSPPVSTQKYCIIIFLEPLKLQMWNFKMWDVIQYCYHDGSWNNAFFSTSAQNMSDA